MVSAAKLLTGPPGRRAAVPKPRQGNHSLHKPLEELCWNMGDDD